MRRKKVSLQAIGQRIPGTHMDLSRLTFAPVKERHTIHRVSGGVARRITHVSSGLIYLWSQGCSELTITKLTCKTHNHATHPMFIGCIPEQNLSLFEEIGGTLSLKSIKIQNIQCMLKIMRNVRSWTIWPITRRKISCKTRLREHRHDWVSKKK